MKLVGVAGTHPDPAHPYWGTFVRSAFQALASSNVKVTALSPRPLLPPFRLPQSLESFRGIPSAYDYGYPVHYPRYPYFVPQRLLYALTGLSYRMFVCPFALRNLETPDLVHAQFEFPDGYGILPAAREWDVPLVLSSHGKILRVHAHGRPESKMVRAALRKADAVCAVSHDQAELAAQVLGSREKVVVVPLGVDPDRFLPSEARRSSSPRVLFVGQLIRRKGVDTLLEAFALVARENSEVRLRIVGEGPERPRLERKALGLGILSRVEFRGTVSGSELPGEYADAHMLVLPSRAEGRPVVIYEAMSAGLPVIASYVGGIPEQVEDGRTGHLVPAGNPRATAEKILDLLAAQGEARAMGVRGRSRLLERGWTWQSHANRLFSVYQAVLQGESPASAQQPIALPPEMTT